MPVNGRSTIDINMDVDNVNLDEVVVVGYGTQKKATLTGSVAVVKGRILPNHLQTNVKCFGGKNTGCHCY